RCSAANACRSSSSDCCWAACCCAQKAFCSATNAGSVAWAAAGAALAAARIIESASVWPVRMATPPAPCHVGSTQVRCKPPAGRKQHDRVLLRYLQSLDLPGLPQHPADGGGAEGADHLAADPGRRDLQHHQSQRLRRAREADRPEGP